MRFMQLGCLLFQSLSALLLLVAVGIIAMNVTKVQSLDSTTLILLLLAFSIAFALNGLLCHGHYRMYWAEQFGSDAKHEKDMNM